MLSTQFGASLFSNAFLVGLTEEPGSEGVRPELDAGIQVLHTHWEQREPRTVCSGQRAAADSEQHSMIRQTVLCQGWVI